MRNMVLEEVFEKLDCWRGFPNYQLERRIDIFFAHYLKVIVENHLLNQGQEVMLHDIIIPEFPVRNSLVGGGNTNHSFKVDYVLFSQQPGQTFFLELKTDMASIDECQKAKLKKISRLAFGDILCDLKKIFVAGNRLKYLYLFECLQRVGYVELPTNLRETIESRGRSKSLIEGIKVLNPNHQISVLYIQPMEDESEENVITFGEIAGYLKLGEEKDPLSGLFAHYLDKWQNPRQAEIMMADNHQGQSGLL